MRSSAVQYGFGGPSLRTITCDMPNRRRAITTQIDVESVQYSNLHPGSSTGVQMFIAHILKEFSAVGEKSYSDRPESYELEFIFPIWTRSGPPVSTQVTSDEHLRNILFATDKGLNTADVGRFHLKENPISAQVRETKYGTEGCFLKFIDTTTFPHKEFSFELSVTEENILPRLKNQVRQECHIPNTICDSDIRLTVFLQGMAVKLVGDSQTRDLMVHLRDAASPRAIELKHEYPSELGSLLSTNTSRSGKKVPLQELLRADEPAYHPRIFR